MHRKLRRHGARSNARASCARPGPDLHVLLLLPLSHAATASKHPTHAPPPCITVTTCKTMPAILADGDLPFINIGPAIGRKVRTNARVAACFAVLCLFCFRAALLRPLHQRRASRWVCCVAVRGASLLARSLASTAARVRAAQQAHSPACLVSRMLARHHPCLLTKHCVRALSPPAPLYACALARCCATGPRTQDCCPACRMLAFRRCSLKKRCVRAVPPPPGAALLAQGRGAQPRRPVVLRSRDRL